MKKNLFVGAIVLLLAAASAFAWTRVTVPQNTSEYQAVLLANGSVYFGRLEGLGSKFPVLHEVYYVQSGLDQESKQPKNVLLKRGGEWHSPDRMILNSDQIVLVEPVGADSRVAGLITQLRGK